ncbi:hypothetical protein BRARA_F03867 [Brassica rapa]|uniref:Uncharacterized protein n=1 Tax=Brassica campestris TaxID=3711 RepID=A0A397Z4Z8_BRACM|nr:hypothetical protein BRARA_F03867 [Brassica rapa]
MQEHDFTRLKLGHILQIIKITMKEVCPTATIERKHTLPIPKHLQNTNIEKNKEDNIRSQTSKEGRELH